MYAGLQRLPPPECLSDREPSRLLVGSGPPRTLPSDHSTTQHARQEAPRTAAFGPSVSAGGGPRAAASRPRGPAKDERFRGHQLPRPPV